MESCALFNEFALIWALIFYIFDGVFLNSYILSSKLLKLRTVIVYLYKSDKNNDVSFFQWHYSIICKVDSDSGVLSIRIFRGNLLKYILFWINLSYNGTDFLNIMFILLTNIYTH